MVQYKRTKTGKLDMRTKQGKAIKAAYTKHNANIARRRFLKWTLRIIVALLILFVLTLAVSKLSDVIFGTNWFDPIWTFLFS